MNLKSLVLGGVVLLSLAILPAHGSTTVTVSVTRSLATAPLFIAVDKGYFRKEGLEVEFSYFNAAQPVAVAVTSGDTQFGITGLSAGFYNMAGQHGLMMIAGGAREEPKYSTGAYFVSNEAYEEGLRTIKDIKGRTFGLTSAGSPYQYSLALAAEKHGFALSDVRMLPLQNFNNVLSAIRGNRVEVGLLNSYVALPAERRGEGKIIAWVGDETPWQLGALFTSSRTIQNDRDVVERFVRAYRAGAKHFHDAFMATGSGVSEAEKIELLGILEKYSRLDEAQIKTSLNYVDREARLDTDDIRKQVRIWQQLGMVGERVRAEDIIDHSFVGTD